VPTATETKLPTPTVKAAINIPATATELKTIADAQARGLCVGAMKAYYAIKTYNVGTADGQKIKVEALDVKGARAKAEAAGYKVAWVTKSVGLSTATKTTLSTESPTPALTEEFKSNNVELGDGMWIKHSDWNALVAADQSNGTNFTSIGKSQGYTAMINAIDVANAPYEEFLKKVEAGDIIPVAGGDYITKEEFNKLPSGSQQIVKTQGFAALESATTVIWEKGSRPVGFSWDPGIKRRQAAWDALPETLTEAEFTKIPFTQKDFYHLKPSSYGRVGALALAGMIPPAKVILPEYTAADITAMDWGIAAAQAPLLVLGFAPQAITGSVLGKVVTTGASTALAGMIGYGTAKAWSGLTPQQRGMGVAMTALCAIPLITTVGRNVKISGTPIPTTKGDAVVWKGLSVAGSPIIGKSGGKWIVGSRGITLPEARMILNGYKPETMLETKVFVNRPALEKAGFTQTQIEYLSRTLKDRNMFAGRSSPWLDKDVLLEPTERLNTNEIGTVMERLNKLEQGFIKKSKIKDAFLLYGSSTIKSQLAPELRNWRGVHDWDISLNMNQAQTEAWAQFLLKDLKVKGGGTYRISPESPTLIEKKINGTWEHIADIHSQELISGPEIATSRLDATGDYSYGRMVAEPAITVKYPGIGELRIMRLSESGVRKADTILRVRQTGEGTAFRPPERGIAQPGVPKDAADFYVTLRTFQGEAVAEDWLRSWAKAMGYTEAELSKVLPRIRTAMQEVAAQTPSDIIGYQFSPAKSPRITTGASPSIVVHVPSSLGASVSPTLGRRISAPIYPYKLTQSPKVRSLAAASLSTMVSKMQSTSPSLAKSLAAASAKPSKVVVPSAKPSPSPKPGSKPPSTSPKPSPPKSGKPSPSPTPSPKASPIPSPVPSPVPSPTPKPTPSPYPYPYPKPGPRPKPLPTLRLEAKPKKYQQREGPALAVWKQGAYWVSIFPPFRTTGRQEDVVYSRERPKWGSVIAKGRHAPKRTLRSMGHVPELITVPMGVVTARIRGGRHLSFSRSNGRKRGRIIK
jgi:hypothetical protein